jgi:hypothetical protein
MQKCRILGNDNIKKGTLHSKISGNCLKRRGGLETVHKEEE